MPKFQTSVFSELKRQLTYAPPKLRREQLERAETLYWEIDTDARYPFAYVLWRITRYQPEGVNDVTIMGEALKKDLLLLVEQLSDTLEDPVTKYDPRPYDLDDLSEKLDVSKKTISRYRREGLFGRRMIFENGRKRLAFRHDSVERFLQARSDRVDRAASFSRIDEQTHHEIITRARRIAGRVESSPFRVARHLAKKYGRSVETIRQLLIKHDEHDPRFAIFPEHTPPLTDKQKRVIHRAYHAGVSVAKMARRYGKARDAIYRAINQMRAESLKKLDIRWIRLKTFELPEAEQVILGSSVPDRVPLPSEGDDLLSDQEGLPSELAKLYVERTMDETTEQLLFARFNFLKYRAAHLVTTLDRYRPKSATLDQIETYLRRAVVIKERLARANLRSVLLVALHHRESRPTDEQSPSLVGLLQEGTGVLLQAIDRFDPTTPGRFAAYISYTLMRHFAMAPISPDSREPEQLRLNRRDYWPAALDPNQAALSLTEALPRQLGALFEELDDTERYIVSRHLGLESEGTEFAMMDQSAATLEDLGEELDMPPERVRRIEHGALKKLRRAARETGQSVPVLDFSRPG